MNDYGVHSITPLQLKAHLVNIKAVIATPEQWTTKWFARDSQGGVVRPFALAACQWCLVGAIRRITEDDLLLRNAIDNHLIECFPLINYQVRDYFPQLPAGAVADPYYQPMFLTHINDELGFDAVHKLLDVAITKSHSAKTE